MGNIVEAQQQHIAVGAEGSRVGSAQRQLAASLNVPAGRWGAIVEEEHDGLCHCGVDVGAAVRVIQKHTVGRADDVGSAVLVAVVDEVAAAVGVAVEQQQAGTLPLVNVQGVGSGIYLATF